MMASRGHSTSGRPGRDKTREKILRAAELLFAKEGFDRVTLRQIARASDQGNVAAVQYHFGSKDGLLSSIVDVHREAIDDRRRELLAEREAEGRGGDLAALIEILVAPLASKLDDPSGRAYLRIQAQGLSNETMRPATRTVVQRIGRSLGSLDESALDPYRGRFALLLLFHALADRAEGEESGRAKRADRSAFVASLSRSLVGLFMPSLGNERTRFD